MAPAAHAAGHPPDAAPRSSAKKADEHDGAITCRHALPSARKFVGVVAD